MKAEHPFFSIIMPCYNAERYLKDALDSVLAQTFTDWELLLIDDGSKDHSLAIAQECLKNEPRAHIFSVPNGGVSKARNIGLDHAQGEWIFFMDADDLILPSHLQSYANAADCDIVFQGWEKFDNDTGEVVDERSYDPLVAQTPDEVAGLMCLLTPSSITYSATWSKIFRRSIIAQRHLQFKEDIHNEEDRIFTTEYYAYAKSARLLPGASYRYRCVPLSLSNAYRKPADILKQMTYFREAFTDMYMTPSLQQLIGEGCSCYFVTIGWMLYRPFHLMLSTSERHRYLRMMRKQFAEAPTCSMVWFMKGNIWQTDLYHLMLYLPRCANYLWRDLRRFYQRCRHSNK